MTSRSVGRLRRLLTDLRRPGTRRAALGRVKRRATSVIRRWTGRAGRGRGPGAVRPGEPASTRRPDRWYVGAWSRLVAAVTAGDPATGSAAIDAAAATTDAVRQARRQRALATFAAGIATGVPIERAVVDSVSALAEDKDWNEAWALSTAVGRSPGGATASSLGLGVLWNRRRQFQRSWSVLEGLTDEALRTFVPVEAIDGSLSVGSAATRQRARGIAVPRPEMDAALLVDLAGRLLAFGERAGAADLAAELRRRGTGGLDGRRRHAWRLIEDWLAARPVEVAPGSIAVGVVAYGSPDHALTSGNLGDHVQTLSMLGNLARLSDVRFTGEDGLGAYTTELVDRIRPELRRPGIRGAIHLVQVDRDFSSAGAVPERTWMVAFGWHMHPLYDLRYDFPYHPNVRPIFVSFHVNRLDMLTDEALAYLRRYGPVGCRDWTTVFLLLSAGVDAFFTGCLTTTVDALFPPRASVYRGRGAVGVIDLPRRAAGVDAGRVVLASHQSDEFRSATATGGLRAASDALAGYQRDLARVVTGRLHAYLPLTALGVPVEFTPGSPGDVRFAGLTGLTPGDARLAAIQGGIRELIAETMQRVLSGATDDEVYAHWRELTRAAVADAKARFEAPVDEPRTAMDIGAAVALSRARSRRFGPHDEVDAAAVTDIVLCFDQNLTWQAAVMFESMLANASGPLRLWVLGRGLSDDYLDWLAAAFPTVPITHLPCDQISYGAIGRIPARITISTMDRLLLPHLLDDIDRVVYVDIDTLVLDDIVGLARTDLRGGPIAARDSNVSEASEWRAAARRLAEGPALELQRRMGRRHGYGGAALNAGVLVLDLERLRRDDFTATYLGWVERYGLNDQDIMLAYAGRSRLVLDPHWDVLPVFEDVDTPGIIHWASIGKPWDSLLTVGQEPWLAFAEGLRQRAGSDPTGGDRATGQAAPDGTLEHPLEIGPVQAALPADLERTVRAVLAEHLTYLGAGPLRTLVATVREIETAKVPGLIIEAGTALGGSAIAMAAAKATDRPMRVYDVFGMIPPPGEKDGGDVHERYATIVRGGSAGIGGDTYYGYRDDLLGEVTNSFARHGVPIAERGVRLVQGRFEDTLVVDEPVALAHLDGDWYESTMTCLTRIVPRLSVGGRLVIDDYDAWSGCRAAVDEYFSSRPGFRFERRGRLHVVRV